MSSSEDLLAMSSQAVQPLRIQKSTSSNSPSRMNAMSHLPLAELSPMAIRRNSPSFPQGNKNNMFKGDSSPFESSPFNSKSTSSPRALWQSRDPNSPLTVSMENRSPFDGRKSPVPTKRSSIENLMKASRVKNSSMFAREQSNQYDPAQPAILDRPLASGRPLNTQVQGNAFGGRGLDVARSESTHPMSSDSQKFYDASNIPQLPQPGAVIPLSPSKNNMSPTKSALSKKPGTHMRQPEFDPSTGIWSDEDDLEKSLPEGRVLRRHAKSVTFDEAPPQINEYETTTPVPSSVASGSREGSYESMDEDEEVSFERGSSIDREDSFDASLEDTDKTPVVLPEDWRFMNPGNANTSLVEQEEDIFNGEHGSPAPTAHPGSMAFRSHQTSMNSVDSNEQTRPLPPLPASIASKFAATNPRDSLLGTMERISSAQRSPYSSPQAASVSKSEIRRMSGSGFSLEERIRLMMLQEQEPAQTEAEKQRERRMRRAKDSSPVRESSADAGMPGPAVLSDDTSEPHLSRHSILRRLRSQQDLDDSSDRDTSPHMASDFARLPPLDPDVPIPSLEDPTQIAMASHREKEVVIKEEEVDEDELYSIPDFYSRQVKEESDAEDEVASQCSQPSLATNSSGDEDGQVTPRAHSPAPEVQKKKETFERVSLPEFTHFGDESSLGLDSYMTPPTENPAAEKELPQSPEPTNLPDLALLRKSILRPTTPPIRFSPAARATFGESWEPGTPDSVIRHPIAESPSPEIPEPDATVKAQGAGLKTRPSITPSDVSTMAATRRQVSGQSMAPPQIPEIQQSRPSLNKEAPEGSSMTTNSSAGELQENGRRIISLVQLEIPKDESSDSLGLGLEKEFDRVVEAQKVAFELSLQRLYYPFNGRFPSSELPDTKAPKNEFIKKGIPVPPKPRGARALPGDQPARGHIYPTDGSHFANRSPYRQRGYLMRQNTKVVVASERISHDESRVAVEPSAATDLTASAPGEVAQPVASRKISQPTWTAEPWIGKSRRRSIRAAGETSPIKRKPVDGPAPPLPGQASNVADALGMVTEDELAEEAEDVEDGAERGRLFVKVVGVKDLELPLPKNSNSKFALTLDNGLHCVTTAWLDLDREAAIGQEFELVVLNELEFQLTLQMKLEEPKIERPSSPTKAPASPTKKQGTFGRLFGSPKKRKESELRAQQEADAAKRPITPPSAYEMVQGLVAKDGSFARAYVALSEHEKQAFGRPYGVDVTCFNEWAMEEVHVGSSRSKKNVTQLQRRPPYEIGKLELQLLYIPKPKGVKDEDMPKSMNSAMRELRDADIKMSQQLKDFEGHLSQQGGDCPYWRRRFFKLVGPKLTAYHETTLQPRATINLAKASKLIDDKSALMKRETTVKGGGRRKSAFAEEEEGYMFVEEGFRLRFANGEVIDFYADSTPEKEEWMKVLSQVVGKGAQGSSLQVKGWAEMILKREKSMKARQRKTQPGDASPQKSTSQLTVQEHMKMKAAASAAKATKAAAGQTPKLQPSALPIPTQKSPTRPQAHSRTESYQPPGSRSQASSPVKAKVTKEERQKKTKSMLY